MSLRAKTKDSAATRCLKLCKRPTGPCPGIKKWDRDPSFREPPGQEQGSFKGPFLIDTLKKPNLQVLNFRFAGQFAPTGLSSGCLASAE